MTSGSFIAEEFFVPGILPPGQMQVFWENGWRHFGRYFFRYSHTAHGGNWQRIVPLRIDLSEFCFSKSQRRVLRKNSDITVQTTPAIITPAFDAMFERHRGRFEDNIPNSLKDFLAAEPAHDPCPCEMLTCWFGAECVAASYFDVDEEAISSVYGMFEPEHSSRSLGILTMLQEICWAMDKGKRWYYPGYATLEPSHYDYKKQFHALQGYDWSCGEWLPFIRL